MLVNKKISALRKEKGMSMTDLARATGITQTSISRYESGKIKKIEEDKLARIADALGVSLEELTGKDPVYEKSTVRGPYTKRGEKISVQDEYDEDLLFTFHQLSDEKKLATLNLFHTIVGFPS